MPEQLYQVQIDNIFEGPMDLLVHLIKKNELDIYDIPIALITEQYLQYLKKKIRYLLILQTAGLNLIL